MTTNRPRGDLDTWRIDKKHFRSGKPLEVFPWIKNPNLLMPAVGFEPTTFQSLSGGVNT